MLLLDLSVGIVTEHIVQMTKAAREVRICCMGKTESGRESRWKTDEQTAVQ